MNGALVKNNSRRIADIEFLRGFTVLFVVHHHIYGLLITWPNAVEPIYRLLGSNFWLDIFFVISGFVIARDLVGRIQRAREDGNFVEVAWRFWLRRMWRLFPTAWLWLFIILACSYGFNSSGAFGSVNANLEATLAGIFQFANLRFADAWSNYEYGASFHYWSLSLEEQFYVALPFVILLAGRWLPHFLLFLVISQFFIERNSLDRMFIYMVRTDGFALGVLLALWAGHPTHRRLEPKFLYNRRWLQGTLGVALVVILSVIDSPVLQLVFFNKGLVVLLSGFIVFLTSYDRDYLWPEGLLKRVLMWIGERSYSIYVVHVPVYCFARELWSRLLPKGASFDASYTLPLLTTALLLLAICVELNFRYIEAPLRRYGIRISDSLSKRHEATV